MTQEQTTVTIIPFASGEYKLATKNTDVFMLRCEQTSDEVNARGFMELKRRSALIPGSEQAIDYAYQKAVRNNYKRVGRIQILEYPVNKLPKQVGQIIYKNYKTELHDDSEFEEALVSGNHIKKPFTLTPEMAAAGIPCPACKVEGVVIVRMERFSDDVTAQDQFCQHTNSEEIKAASKLRNQFLEDAKNATANGNANLETNESETPDIYTMELPELKEFAKANGIEFEPAVTAANLLKLIEASLETA